MKYFRLILLYVLFFSSCTSDGPNPSESAAAEDKLQFNKWVYKEMNHQYLWREDLPDSMKCDYSLAPKDFFKSLLSPKDRFSYFTTNPGYTPQSSSNLGFAYQTMSDKNKNTALEILYIQSDELKACGFKRGDFVNIDDTGKDNYTINKVHLQQNCFKDDSHKYSISKSNQFESSTVLLDSVYLSSDKRIGYLCYLEYGELSDLETPLKKFQSEQITDLILDLRYNPGGYVRTCRFLCNCIVNGKAYGKIFQKCSYNDILSAEYLKNNGNEMTYSFFEIPEEKFGESLGVNLTPLNLNSLYVITSSHTASASEATIICLKPYMDVIVIGETTVGKGVGSWRISDKRFHYAIQPITMRYYNADMISTPDEGINPDICLSDVYTTGKLEIGDINEKLLKVALAYIAGEYTSIETKSSNEEAPIPISPIGDPSYISEFNNKYYNENN